MCFLKSIHVQLLFDNDQMFNQFKYCVECFKIEYTNTD